MNEFKQVTNAVYNLTNKDLKQTLRENNLTSLDGESSHLNEDSELFLDSEDGNKNNYQTTKRSLVLTKQLIEDEKINIEEYIVNSLIFPAITDKIKDSAVIKNESVKLSFKETGLEDYPITLFFNFETVA